MIMINKINIISSRKKKQKSSRDDSSKRFPSEWNDYEWSEKKHLHL